jgi:hypothetical protein
MMPIWTLSLKPEMPTTQKNVIKYGLRILRDFCVQREILFEEFEQSTKEEMCETLKAFYAAMRSKKGEYYSTKAMVSVRYAIQRHILKLRNFDIVNDGEFNSSNLMFNAMLMQYKYK